MTFESLRDDMRRIMNRQCFVVPVDEDTNFDEYDPEIKRICLRFDRKMDPEEFGKIVYDVFVEMFSENCIDSYRDRVVNIAKELYDFLRRIPEEDLKPLQKRMSEEVAETEKGVAEMIQRARDGGLLQEGPA
jgi:hypothetical protein